jgi:hypothetical protein
MAALFGLVDLAVVDQTANMDSVLEEIRELTGAEPLPHRPCNRWTKRAPSCGYMP